MEEKKLKISALQMSSKLGDVDTNFKKVLELTKNINSETDILVLPEVWTIGWKPSLFRDLAEDLSNSKTIGFLSELAVEHNINIIGGSFITKADNKYYNTCPVINKKGGLIATYDKMHLFSYFGCDENKYVQKGANPVLININGIKIGLSICYDIRFPELFRAYRKAGADLLINMAAWPKSRPGHWDNLTKARAIENQTFMLALTQSGLIENDEYNLGTSMLINYNGDITTQINDSEGLIYNEIDFIEMYKFRKNCTILKDIQEEYRVKQLN